MITTLQTTLSQYFLNPTGLIALAALIPLIIIYLIAPKPQEEIMPAMRFFSKQENEGKLKKAYRKLLQNLILILHILIIITAAIAIAEPFQTNQITAEQSIIIIDNDITTQNNLEQIKTYAEERTSQNNIIISATGETEIITENADQETAINQINQKEATHLNSNIRNALSTAADYQGEIILASNLPTIESENDLIQILRQNQLENRETHIYESNFQNNIGIINKELEQDTATLTIKNYQEATQQTQLQVNNQTQNLELGPQEIQNTQVRLTEGINQIKIEDDDFQQDSQIEIKRPTSTEKQIAIDQQNPYIKQVFESIGNINLVQEPENLQNLDNYIITESETLQQENTQEYIQNENNLILFQDTLEASEQIETGERNQNSIRITKPLNQHIGITETFKIENNIEKTWTNPENAIFTTNTSKTYTTVFNIEKENIQNQIAYPLIWNQIIKEMHGQQTIEQLNQQTGSSLPEQTTRDDTIFTSNEKIIKEGVYQGENHLYAINNFQENNPATSYSEQTNSGETNQIQETLQNNILIILITLIIIELAYLKTREVI